MERASTITDLKGEQGPTGGKGGESASARRPQAQRRPRPRTGGPHSAPRATTWSTDGGRPTDRRNEAQHSPLQNKAAPHKASRVPLGRVTRAAAALLPPPQAPQARPALRGRGGRSPPHSPRPHRHQHPEAPRSDGWPQLRSWAFSHCVIKVLLSPPGRILDPDPKSGNSEQKREGVRSSRPHAEGSSRVAGCQAAGQGLTCSHRGPRAPALQQGLDIKARPSVPSPSTGSSALQPHGRGYCTFRRLHTENCVQSGRGEGGGRREARGLPSAPTVSLPAGEPAARLSPGLYM